MDRNTCRFSVGRHHCLLLFPIYRQICISVHVSKEIHACFFYSTADLIRLLCLVCRVWFSKILLIRLYTSTDLFLIGSSSDAFLRGILTHLAFFQSSFLLLRKTYVQYSHIFRNTCRTQQLLFLPCVTSVRTGLYIFIAYNFR